MNQAQQPDPHTRTRIAIAVALVIVILTAAQALYIFSPPENDFILHVAQEIEQAHTEAGGNIHVIRSNAENPLPQRLNYMDYEVTATEQTTLQGEAATRLRLKDKQGRRATLYITQTNELFHPLHNRTQQRAEIEILMWREPPLFYAMAATNDFGTP